MHKFRNLTALLLCAALLLGLLGCGAKKAPEEAPADQPVAEAPADAPELPEEEPAEQPPEVPEEPPVSDLYTQAAEALRNAQDLSLSITSNVTTATEADTFEQVSEQTLVLTGVGTDAFAATLNETLLVDELDDSFSEYYKDGILYVNVYDTGYFQGEMTEEDFLARFAPAALLEESLYAEITAEDTDDGMLLTFSAPAAAESWALPEGAEFVEASGTAAISADGVLTETTYTVKYTAGNAAIAATYTSSAELCDADALVAPEDLTQYVAVESIMAPRLYDTSILYLFSAETSAATLNQTVVSQAAGYVMAESTEMRYTGTESDHLSEIVYSVTVTDNTMASETYSQTEAYRDGLYTFTTEGQEPETDANITPDDMVGYMVETLSLNFPAMQYLTSAKVTDVGGLLYLEMDLSEEWGEGTEYEICYTLFGNGDFLDDFASAYKTDSASYYMVLDPVSCFPISAGTTFSGIHTIEGADFILSREVGLTCRLADPGTVEVLAEESEPEEQATPLLYHVTGADGQEMYLIGTIHVGDNRTAFLPDEVYAAFDASDALAVEADIMSLEEEMAADASFAVQLAQLCINPGGGSIQNLISEELYEKALLLLKASGNYNANMDMMKPYMWCNTIENFYLSLSSLSSDQGMDMRLLEMAKEQEKEILEVESVLEQFEMLMGFSTELQTLLLEDAAECTAAEYCADVEELYALWCGGDEAILREMLNEETEEGMTEEELALSKEYLDAMIIERNEGMLDVAVSYLESGDTVFYAVGLAHLLQENGLVDTLREAGYTVEQVAYN